MWIRRATLYIQPGRMADAIAHVKELAARHPGWRISRPLTGPEAQLKLVVEGPIEDPAAELASYGSASPPSEEAKRWHEMNQSRGDWELFEVEHEVPAKGTPGKWIDRRIRYVQRGRVHEMLELWRNAPEMKPVEGFSLKVMTPRTGERAGTILIAEITGATPEFVGTSGFADAAAAAAWAMRVHALEERECTVELLREVD